MKLLWLTDLHLDKLPAIHRNRYLHSLGKRNADVVLITGDISNATFLRRDLCELADVFSPRPVYFITGNHDFFGGSFDSVEETIQEACDAHANLVHLDGRQLIRLDSTTALLGLTGWPDLRAGTGIGTPVTAKELFSIGDFRQLGRYRALGLMRQLGMQAASTLREVLPYALTCYRRVIVATHFPLFPQSVRFDDEPSVPNVLPYFCNKTAGRVIQSIASRYSHREIVCLAGHTHSATSLYVLPNLQAITGSKRGLNFLSVGTPALNAAPSI